MEYPKKYPIADFFKRFKRTGVGKHSMFSGNKGLMEEIYATGNPIYCNQTYYHQETYLDLVEKVGEHFHCDNYTTFENWRDCHYYSEYADAEGNKVWLMTGGRYD